MKWLKLYIIPIILILFSCENEIDLYDEFVESPVVYGLVNPNNQTHIIRINKTFMPDYNPQNALYDNDLKTYDSVEAFIEEWNNTSLVNTYILKQYTEPDNPYVSSYNKNPLYYFDAKLVPNYKYKLNIITSTSTDTVKAETDIIGKLSYFYTQQFFVDFSTDDKRVVVRWRAPLNATIFILSFKFDYFEVQNNDTTLYTITKLLFDERFRAYEDDDPMVTVITGRVFYDMIKENIEIKDNVIRIATPPKFEIKMGDEELYDIIISAAAKDLDFPIYENGQYTNLENGLGIFTSVYDTTLTMRYNSRTLDTLATRNDVKAYNFRNYIIEN